LQWKLLKGYPREPSKGLQLMSKEGARHAEEKILDKCSHPHEWCDLTAENLAEDDRRREERAEKLRRVWATAAAMKLDSEPIMIEEVSVYYYFD
jgi:ATP:corrinoid adenosyltransferase